MACVYLKCTYLTLENIIESFLGETYKVKLCKIQVILHTYIKFYIGTNLNSLML